MNAPKPVEVAAAVLCQEGRFLLARRPEGKVCAGYWEFPGGKVEAGESVHEALVRELWEEMGITVTRATPWLTRRFIYPHASVRVHFWRVTEWTGEIDVTAPLEHEALAWQPCRGPAPTVAPILPTNAPILKALALPTVMAITHNSNPGPADSNSANSDPANSDPADSSASMRRGSDRELQRLVEGLRGGDICVQLRDRDLSPAARRRWAHVVQTLAAAHAAPMFVSEDGSGEGAALAREIGAAGLHLTSSALTHCAVRPDFPWAGASCHTAEELELAETLGLDYALLGPVLPTPSHPETAGLGWETFARLVKNRGLPVFAIGGQDRTTCAVAQQHGAHGIAALRGRLHLPRFR
ncbi:MAG: thiamine phosphate synthase [Zoogloeaceae bacterium]|jgi:8-oxo-dGTP diphosphatase|nr:thiamine phosphate synthase [Zoogloeaceae bacterium]